MFEPLSASFTLGSGSYTRKDWLRAPGVSRRLLSLLKRGFGSLALAIFCVLRIPDVSCETDPVSIPYAP